MKAFKKLALVTAIAAAPFAQAEMVAIDDALMGEMTGQAGITIELSTEVKIGSVVYTDTDGASGLTTDAGSLNITGVTLGGSTLGTALDGIKIDIDVDDNDGLVIHLGGTNQAGVLTGDAPVDFGLSVDAVSLNTGNPNLVSDVRIEGNLGPIDVVIANNGDIGVDAYFEVTNGSMNVDVLGLGVSNLTIGDNAEPFLGDAKYTADVTNFQGYYSQQVVDQAALITANTGLDGSTAAADAVAAQAAGVAAATWTQDPDPLAVVGEDVNGKTQADLIAEAQTAADLATASGTVALSLSAPAMNAKAVAGVSNMAYVKLAITTGAAGYATLNGSDASDWSADKVEVSNALLVTVAKMNMDIGMDLTMGTAKTNIGGIEAVASGPAVGTSLGSVVINDLDLSGTTLAIYGH